MTVPCCWAEGGGPAHWRQAVASESGHGIYTPAVAGADSDRGPAGLDASPGAAQFPLRLAKT